MGEQASPLSEVESLSIALEEAGIISVNSEYLLYTHTHTHTQKHTLLQLFMHTHGHTYTKRTCTYTQLYVDAHKFFHYRQQTKSHVFAQPHSWTKPYTT